MTGRGRGTGGRRGLGGRGEEGVKGANDKVLPLARPITNHGYARATSNDCDNNEEKKGSEGTEAVHHHHYHSLPPSLPHSLTPPRPLSLHATTLLERDYNTGKAEGSERYRSARGPDSSQQPSRLRLEL